MLEDADGQLINRAEVSPFSSARSICEKAMRSLPGDGNLSEVPRVQRRPVAKPLAEYVDMGNRKQGMVAAYQIGDYTVQGGLDPGDLLEVPVIMEQGHAVLHRNLGDQAVVRTAWCDALPATTGIQHAGCCVGPCRVRRNQHRQREEMLPKSLQAFLRGRSLQDLLHNDRCNRRLTAL